MMREIQKHRGVRWKVEASVAEAIGVPELVAERTEWPGTVVSLGTQDRQRP